MEIHPGSTRTRATVSRNSAARDSGKGFVLKFHVERGYLSEYEVQTVGARNHRELWIPAEELSEFNRHIVGTIDVIHTFGATAE